MNTNEAVAGEVAAPAASEAAAPAAGQESVGVGPAGPDGLPVATPAGSAAARVQLGTLPRSKTLLSSNGTLVEVTFVARSGGKNTKTSWVWTVMHQFSPLVNGKNVFCSACKKLLYWKGGTGTSGLSRHYDPVQNIPSGPVVAASRPGSPAVARSSTKNPVDSRRGCIPPGESRGGRIPYRKSR